MTGPPYVVLEYCDRMDLAYAAADLVVARSGANTVCELTAVGLPAVYVPLPIGNGEQRLNAAAAVIAAGGGLLVDDADVTPALGATRSWRRSPSTTPGSRRWPPRPHRWGSAAATSCSPTSSSRPHEAPAMTGPTPRYDFTAPVPPLELLGRVHLIAIGGAGMSAVARLLLARGVPVSGSDAADSPTLEALRAQRCPRRPRPRRGARRPTSTPWWCRRPSATTTSSSRRPAPPGLRVLHRSQALASLMGGSRRVAVAGANGKTTTTSMLVVALVAAGADPSFASGARSPSSAPTPRSGAGPAFVVEADESDGSFLAYRPDVAVVTNVQPDHLDFYGTREAVESAYAAFVDSVTEGGLARRLPRRPRVAPPRRRRPGGRAAPCSPTATPTVPTCGSARWRSDDLGTRSVLVHDGVERVLDLAVPGDHNVMDACAAYLAAVAGLGADPEAVLAGLAGLRWCPPPVRGAR